VMLSWIEWRRQHTPFRDATTITTDVNVFTARTINGSGLFPYAT